jgi:hypothetical protein
MQLQFEVRGGVTADGQAAVETIIVQDGVTTTFTLPVPEVGKLLKGYKDAIRQAATALGARNGIAPPLEPFGQCVVPTAQQNAEELEAYAKAQPPSCDGTC